MFKTTSPTMPFKMDLEIRQDPAETGDLLVLEIFCHEDSCDIRLLRQLKHLKVLDMGGKFFLMIVLHLEFEYS